MEAVVAIHHVAVVVCLITGFLVQVLHQSYFLASGLKALGVTATRKGITSKQLLLGTASNQVWTFPADKKQAKLAPAIQSHLRRPMLQSLEDFAHLVNSLHSRNCLCPYNSWGLALGMVSDQYI